MNNNIVTQKLKKQKYNWTNKIINKFGTIINYALLPIIILLVWWLVTRNKIFPSAILPSIGTVVNSFISQLQSGQLLTDIGTSLSRVIKGYLVASFLGITLGVLMGISKKINCFFSGTLSSIRQIPIMAWIPLIILWVGVDEGSKVVIIALGAFFPVLINTISGINQIPEGYIEVGRMFKLSKWDLFRNIYFPSAIPSIFVGLKLSLGISWSIVVAAELIASTSGIGYRINDARSLMQSDVVIVGMIVIGAIGIMMDRILAIISKKITPWENRK